MGSKPLDIYFFPPSPPSRAALLLIKALDLKHNIKTTNIVAGDHLKPDFLKMNPLHTIPVINDNGWVLYDSTVIMKYLVDQYGKDDSLFPKDPKKGAIVLQRCLFNATYLFPKFVEYHAPYWIITVLNSSLNHLFNDLSHLHFEQVLQAPTLFAGTTPSEKSLKALEEVLKHLNNFLDNQMYVAGENITVADFGIITIIASIDACGSIDITQYPNMWLWYQRCKNTMKPYGYEEINQEGADMFGQMYKKQLGGNNK